MLGREHALSGAVTGLAAGEFALHLPPAPLAALAGLTAAFATLPDLDTARSCAARSLGFLSGAFAWLVEKASGGHRHGTHSLLGAGVFTAGAWAACHYRASMPARVALGLFLALALAAGLRALHARGHLADAAALAAAAVIAAAGRDLQAVWLACGLGCLTHIAGDMLTTEGCPLAWPLTLRHYRLLPAPLDFTTGTWRETRVVFPLLLASLGALAWLALPPR
jgi:membrane-bound metal-dependent hydrolase YbcI (DUF457 family)